MIEIIKTTKDMMFDYFQNMLIVKNLYKSAYKSYENWTSKISQCIYFFMELTDLER